MSDVATTGGSAETPGKLLIVKFGAIGDVVMAIPGAFAMHAAGYTVDWVCGEAVAPVLRLYPWIRVIAVNETTLLRGSAGERLRGMAALWRTLAGQTYDTCATLYYDRRYRLLTAPVRARRKVMLSWTDRRTTLLPGRHHTDEFARILAGTPDTETPQQLPPVRVEGLPASPMPPPDRPRVVLVPAGARNLLRDDALRRWPVESYVELARRLVAGGCEVVLAGGPGDRWASEFFAGEPDVLDRIGQDTLPATLALLESAAVTVCHDTGPLHLAGLTSTAILTIFGPTDPRGRLPQRANCVALWGGEGFACRPCYDGQGYAPCPHNGCIRQVTPGMALDEVLALLALGARGEARPPRIVVPEHTPAAVFVRGPA